MSFSERDIPDLSGRTVVVTGANSGIGRAAAQMFAEHGARVILAVRDLSRGAEAAAGMSGATEVRRLDLADLASVREFADALDGELALLINNAGVMMTPLTRTVDGFELQFGTNHLGHFALTNLLLPRITERVVTVSSALHRGGHIDFDDPNWERRRYRPSAAYRQSKLANLLFTAELQRRLAVAGSSLLATAAHPGYAATSLQSHAGNPFTRLLMTQIGNRFFAQSERAGALPTVYAAVADAPGNSYAGPGAANEMRGAPRLVGRSPQAADADLARRLWELSEGLTGVSFPL
jgi:NAD(P)-dependent dehydrogenase (short-subunit alcohol dehydrogenase family)